MQQTHDLRFRRRAIQTPGEQQPKNKFGITLTVVTAALILPALVYTVTHPTTVTSTVRQIAKHVQMKSIKVAVVASRATPTPQPSPTATPQPTSTPDAAKATKEHEAALHQEHLKHLHMLAVAHAKKLASTGQAADVGASGSSGSAPAASTASQSNGAGAPKQASPATATPSSVALAPQQPQADATPVYAPNVVVDARFTHEVQPDYPEIAKMQNAQGTAVVLATIGPNGQVLSAHIDQSTGNKLLDAAALNAAKSSGFQPPLIDGKPATETYRLVYTFAL